MKDTDIADISQSIIARGLAGQSELALLHGFCEECTIAGLDLAIATAVIDTLHPIHEGRAFHWRADGAVEKEISEYTTTSYSEENWRKSTFYHLLQSGEDELRRRILASASKARRQVSSGSAPPKIASVPSPISFSTSPPLS